MLEKFPIEGRFKNERDFNRRYNKKLRNLGRFVKKFPDETALSLKEFDSIAVDTNGFAYAIEFKMINHFDANVYTKLRPHQRKNLRTFPGKSYVIVYNRDINDYVVLEYQNVMQDEKVKLFYKL